MKDMVLFQNLLFREVDDAVGTYPPINNVHEGYAIILEELEEFWAECKLKPGERNDENMRRELVQIAAMAARTYMDAVGR